MNIAIYTLGCKVNQYETQAVETMLRERGHSPALLRLNDPMTEESHNAEN